MPLLPAAPYGLPAEYTVTRGGIRAVIAETVALRAGSDGATLANARRAWETFKAFVQERGLPNDGLPASAA